MSTSALSGVIDYLVAQLTTIVAAYDPNGIVVEGWVDEAPPPPAPIVVVGMPSPDSALAADETRQYLALGSGNVEEAFDIPCYIDVYVGGTDQSLARKAVCTVFDAVVDLVRSDLTLGGNLKRGRFAELTDIRLVGTRDVEEAQSGRRSVLSFVVRCRNFY